MWLHLSVVKLWTTLYYIAAIDCLVYHRVWYNLLSHLSVAMYTVMHKGEDGGEDNQIETGY